MRLDRFLSLHGFGSRRSSKKVISNGRVFVNGKMTTQNEMQITTQDKIEVDGEEIENVPYLCLLMNKPQNYMCSMIDERYPSVLHLVPEIYQKQVRLVGRLDADTTGLLLLTDNGVLNARLTNPKYHVEKTYAVTVNHILKPELVDTFAQGQIDLGQGDIADKSKLVVLDEYHAELTVHEGKYHEVKRLFGKFGYDVLALKRISFGPVQLGDLKEGTIRKATEEEYVALIQATGLKKEETLL